MAARDEHDRAVLAVWSRIAQALEQIAANTKGQSLLEQQTQPYKLGTILQGSPEPPPKPMTQENFR